MIYNTYNTHNIYNIHNTLQQGLLYVVRVVAVVAVVSVVTHMMVKARIGLQTLRVLYTRINWILTLNKDNTGWRRVVPTRAGGDFTDKIAKFTENGQMSDFGIFRNFEPEIYTLWLSPHAQGVIAAALFTHSSTLDSST